MRSISFARRIAGSLIAPLIASVALWLGGMMGPAFAIPSPELVVGSFASLSQLFALASALLGGGAAVATMRLRAHGETQRVSRALTYVAVGLFVLLCGSVGINIYQYVSEANARQTRLEMALTRPTPTIAGRSLDSSLKEVSYDEQLRHPRGISTTDLERVLEAKARGERKDVVLLDIRETAETEMGTMPGARTIRYPDIGAAGSEFSGKSVILYCHNGNRSFETCQLLAALGIDCRFLVGGLEKWLVEGHSLSGLSARTLTELRALPRYRNQDMLLDTPQVRELVQNEGAVFVDVRYPGEFAAYHLPGAINLPIRPTPTRELKERIAALPHRPIVAPCYDRRSCFFAEVLGLELSRAGHDFRGRYTVPWEYFVPSAPRPYVQQWLVEANKGYYARAAEALAGVLRRVADQVGLITAILLLALVSRFLVLPFSLKAERDQIRSRAAAEELNALKQQFKDDPVGRTRALRAAYQRLGITPMRNLLALLFLPIMAIALLAVQDLSTQANEGLLWIADLGSRDPWLILPVLFGALITLYLDLAFATTLVERLGIWLVGLPLLTATGAFLGAGADVYLVFSAGLLVVQRLWVSGALANAWRALLHRRLPKGVIGLADASRLADCGNKAYRLACMRAAGMPVPDGVLLTSDFLARFAQMPADARRRELDRIWHWLGWSRVAVRSSGSGEDGANHSFAGVFESVLDVDRGGLEAAIAKVWASFEAARAGSYLDSAGSGNVLIQRMVNAEYAGVLFTRDPSAGGLTMIEMVQGTAENLVSGSLRPSTYRYGRISKKPFGHESAPIDLSPLLALGDRVERLFGRPQDIEWTYRDGCFYLVQSRDITRAIAGDADTVVMQNDLARALDAARGLAADEVAFGKNELSEMLPRPTPLSLSLMQALWASGGSIDLAARRLGLSYRVGNESAYLTTICGRLYVNKREERSRSLVVGPLATRRLLRNAEKIEHEFRSIFLPQFCNEMRSLNAIDFDMLSTTELIAEIKRLHDRFVFDTHVAVDAINIAANFYLDRAREVLRESGADPSALLGHIPETYESRALEKVQAAPAKRRRWMVLKHFGHRAVLDYELAEPRYAEDLDALNRMIAGRAHAPRSADRHMPSLSKSLARTVDIACRFQTLKEDAKHHSLAELAVIRRAVLTLDRRFGFNGRIFYLKFSELFELGGQNAISLRKLASIREEERSRLEKYGSLPSNLTVHDLESASAGELNNDQIAPGIMCGTRVSGSKVVEARARVIASEDAERGNPIGFCDGDIIVANMINPAWLPYFSRAGGFVSEVGGWLSHPAILAREYDVPMIVGVEGIHQIVDGDRLRLHLDGRIEVVSSECKAGQVVAA